MRTDERRRVLYGLGPCTDPHRRQARLLGEAFAREGVEVDFLLGGPGKPRLLSREALEAEPADTARERHGPSVFGAGSLRALRGVTGFDIERYAFALSESEPLSAWASRVGGIPCTGIGHRSASASAAPHGATDRAARWLRERRLPLTHELATYWLSASPELLPPLIDTTLERHRLAQDFTLVFLPGEETVPLVSLLAQMRSRHFIVYSPAVAAPSQQHNVSLYPVDGDGFRHHLERAARLVCHADPGLVAQALYLGLPLLIKPVDGDAGQKADARALEVLGHARLASTLGILTLDRFVGSTEPAASLAYPDVAREIARECLYGDPRDAEGLAARLWGAMPTSRAA